MTRIARALALLLALLAVSACGSAPQTSGTAVGAITLHVSGGFTGWDRTLTVEPDGTARIQVAHGPSPSVASRPVESAVLARLHSLVSEPAFAQLAPAYLPSPGGADLQDYVVTAEVADRTLRTMSRDGANPPPALRDVLAILNGVLSAAYTR